MQLIKTPLGLPIQSFQENQQGGPQGISSTSGTSHVQTSVDPFGLWYFDIEFADMTGPMARRFDRWRTGFMAGANCARLTFKDVNEPSYQELGLNVGPTAADRLKPSTNGKNFTNGRPWTIGKPICPITADAAYDSAVITLDITNWTNKKTGIVCIPAWFGTLDHMAAYKVLEDDIKGNIARLHVWPPIRKDIKAGGRATFNPVICVSAISSTGKMEGQKYTNASMTVREVLQETIDSHVIEGF